MKIRQIERDELNQIESLWTELKQYQQECTIDFAQHYLDITFKKRKTTLLAKDRIAVFVAENEEASIGFCVVSINGKQGEVDSLYVQPERRGINVGRSLMKAGMEWLGRQYLENIRLFVGQGNEEVISFYENLGFRKRATMMEFLE